MERKTKQIIALALALVLFIGAGQIGGGTFFTHAEANSLSAGDIIEFGSYPQSEVSDSALIQKLNELSLNWISYEYYSGNGKVGSMTKSDYMKYADVFYNGNKYRAVIKTAERPECTYLEHASAYNDESIYRTGTTYWFKYEKIKWRVLDPQNGLVMSEIILDSQPFNNLCYKNEKASSGYQFYSDASYTTYANDYADSSIRIWLLNDFYDLAFSNDEKSKILTTELNNKGTSLTTTDFDSATTYDKVFLLSHDDVFNTDYGFAPKTTSADTEKRAIASDYAKIQGVYINTDSNNYHGNSSWLLRSPGSTSQFINNIAPSGNLSNQNERTYNTNNGIRPAITVNKNVSYSTTTNPTASGTEATTEQTETEATTSETVKSTITVSIKNCNNSSQINYGETLRLTAITTNMPNGAYVRWSVEGNGVSIKQSVDGKTCDITSTANGTVTVTATVVDENGNAIQKDNGEFSASQTIKSNAGFFQKIISFLKNLFGINRVISQKLR